MKVVIPPTNQSGVLDMKNSGAYEQELSQAPEFADPNEIISSVITFYVDGLLDLLESNSALHQSLLSKDSEILFSIYQNPSLRHLITAAIVKNAQGQKVEDLISQAGKIFVRMGERPTPRKESIVEKALFSPSSACRDDYDVFMVLFDEHIADGVATDKAAILDATDEDLTVLNDGVELLQKAVPTMAASLLPHASRVVLIDHADESKRVGRIRANMGQNVSTHAIPGTIFLSPSALRSPTEAAEAILHEAAHKKLSDLVLTRDVFIEGYDLQSAAFVEAIWNRSLSWNDNKWTTDRALFAFHVYVYLSAYYLCVVDRDVIGIESAFAKKRAIGSIRRANYLGRALQNELADDLGGFGKRFVQWLWELITKISANVDIGCVDLYLYMDRYDHDTVAIKKTFEGFAGDWQQGSWNDTAAYSSWPVERVLNHLIHSEIVSFNRLLFVLGERSPARLPNYDGDNWSSVIPMYLTRERRLDYLVSTRKFISDVVRSQPSDALTRSIMTRREQSLLDLVADMAEHAYRHLPEIKKRSIEAA